MRAPSPIQNGRLRSATFQTNIKGMTLMEVVIAIGVVAFVIPLILAATGSAGSSRRNAEADTRSAWLAREIQQELIVSWGENPSKSIFETNQNFPSFASAADPDILLYDSKGEFLKKGSNQDFTKPSQEPQAAFVVALYAEEYNPPNLTSTANPLTQVHIRVLHPAKTTPGKRSNYRYNFITTRQGTL